jgi:hypothetical protein
MLRVSSIVLFPCNRRKLRNELLTKQDNTSFFSNPLGKSSWDGVNAPVQAAEKRKCFQEATTTLSSSFSGSLSIKYFASKNAASHLYYKSKYYRNRCFIDFRSPGIGIV